MYFAVVALLIQTLSAEDAQKLARVVLERELGPVAENAQIRRTSAVEWPDEGLGCAEPSKTYPQRAIPGFIVYAQVEGAIHSVHVGNGRGVVCGQAFRPHSVVERKESFTVEREEAAPQPTDPELIEAVEEARSDLAERLSIDSDRIEVLEAVSVVWPDRSLGCPHPEMGYQQVEVDGVRIRLRVGKREYDYHGGGSRKPFLCENPA